MTQNDPQFSVSIMGIIFNPLTKKILIGKGNNDSLLPNLTWCFPWGKAVPGEDVDITLKNNVKAKTGLTVKNLGAIFSKTYPEKENLLGVYFLCESFEGEEQAGDSFSELKWIDPEELESHFTTSFHKKLEQFLIELK